MKRNKSTNRREAGQTLLLAVLAIIVLLIAALFLFDLQTIIRVKIKSQSAADAAALAGARMQQESLNLIGEINLIKACTVLITDYADDSSDDALMAASENLTEMQARVSFVGPLIGVGAAQQAAKNNGMVDPSQVSDDPAYNEFSLSSYITDVEDEDGPYANDLEQTIEGYEWRLPYIEMLKAINNEGVAAGPSGVNPNVNTLFSLDLVNAILTEFWCHNELRQLIKDDSNFEGQWWQGLVTDVGFVEESELLPLYVTYTDYDSTGESYHGAVEEAREYLTDLAEERGMEVGMITQMPYMQWCLYGSRWNNAPGEGWVESSDQLYLRRGLRPEYLYGGAVTKMTCLIPGGEDSKFQWLAGSYQVHSAQREDGVISQDKSNTPTVRSSALAKPLGFLEADGTRIPPNDISMILPIFKSVRLMPTAMISATSIYDQDYLFYKFLKWLDTVADIDNPTTSPPAGTATYLFAFQRLNNPLWRHSGYNPAFVYEPPDLIPIYDPETDTGAGVLQWPVPNPNGDEDPNNGYEYDDDGVITGIAYTYEDRCDWSPPGGGGGGGGHGGGGPGSLH